MRWRLASPRRCCSGPTRRCAAPKRRLTRSSGNETQKSASRIGRRGRFGGIDLGVARHVGSQGARLVLLHARRDRRRQGRSGAGGPARRDGRARFGPAPVGWRDDPLRRDGREGAHAGRLSRDRAGPVPRRLGSGRRRAAREWHVRRRHDSRQARRTLHAARARQSRGRAQGEKDAEEMIAETGLAALWLAAGLAALQLVLMILALRTSVEAGRSIRAIAVVQGVLTLIAFATLLLVFARSDM